MQYCGSIVRCEVIIRMNWWNSVAVWLVAPIGWCKPQCAICLNSGGLPRSLQLYQYSQQQHTVFTSTHCYLSTVDSLNELRVTVLLCFQSDTHRRLWNREKQWAKLSKDRGFPEFWNWKKCLQYRSQFQNRYRGNAGSCTDWRQILDHSRGWTISPPESFHFCWTHSQNSSTI